MRKIVGALILVFAMAMAMSAHAQLQPIPVQGSASAEGSHVFGGSLFSGIVINWQAATTARYFMLFDATSLPANGSTTSCTTTQSNGCLALCIYLTESTSAPNRFALDYTQHPIAMRSGVTAALSTGAGCGTLTVDTTSNFFYSQVR